MKTPNSLPHVFQGVSDRILVHILSGSDSPLQPWMDNEYATEVASKFRNRISGTQDTGDWAILAAKVSNWAEEVTDVAESSYEVVESKADEAYELARERAEESVEKALEAANWPSWFHDEDEATYSRIQNVEDFDEEGYVEEMAKGAYEFAKEQAIDDAEAQEQNAAVATWIAALVSFESAMSSAENSWYGSADLSELVELLAVADNKAKFEAHARQELYETLKVVFTKNADMSITLSITNRLYVLSYYLTLHNHAYSSASPLNEDPRHDDSQDSVPVGTQRPHSEWKEALDEYWSARFNLEEAKTKFAITKNQVSELLGSKRKFVTQGYRIQRYHYSGNINYKKVAESLFGGIREEFSQYASQFKTHPYTRLHIVKRER